MLVHLQCMALSVLKLCVMLNLLVAYLFDYHQQLNNMKMEWMFAEYQFIHAYSIRRAKLGGRGPTFR